MDTGKKTIAEIGALAKQKGRYADMDDISAGKLLLEEYPEYWFHISDGEKAAKDVMSVDEFGKLIKSKKPEYADRDDRSAAMDVLEKYPAYWRTVVEKKSPGGTGSASGYANGYANDMPNNPIRPVSVMPEEYWGAPAAPPVSSIEGDPATKGGKPVSVMPDEQLPAPSRTPEPYKEKAPVFTSEAAVGAGFVKPAARPSVEEVENYFESDEYKSHVEKMDSIAGPVYERNVKFLDQNEFPEGEKITPGYKKKVEAEAVGDGRGQSSYKSLYENDFIDKLMESPEFKDLDDKQRYEVRMYLDSKVRGRDLEKRIDEEMKRSFKARGVELTDEGGLKVIDDINSTIQDYNNQITKVQTSLALTVEEARRAVAEESKKSTVKLEGLKSQLEAAVAAGGITADEANSALEKAYMDELENNNRFVRSQNAYIEKVYSETRKKYENKLNEQLAPLKAKAAAAGIDIGEDGSIVAERLLKEVSAGAEMRIRAEEQLRKLRGYAGMSGGERWKTALTSGVGDMIQTMAGAYLNKGYYEMGESLRRAAKSMQFEDFPELPEFTFSQSLTDPMFWMTKGVRMLPFTLALMVPAVATGGVAGAAAGALGAGAVTSAAISAGAATAMSRPLESLMEGGGRYLEVLERGGSVEEAQKEFAYVNSRNYALLMSDFIQFGAIFLPGGAALKAGALLVGSGLEGTEEVYQEWINKRAGDRDYALIEFMRTPEAKEVFALGTANGLAFESLGLLNTEGRGRAEARKLNEKKMRESLAIMLAHGEGLVVRKKQLANMMDIQLLNGIITREQYQDALKVLDKVASDLQAFSGKNADDAGTRSQFLELMHNLAEINSRMENASPEAKEVLKAQKAEVMKEIESLRAGTAPGYFVDDVYYSKEDFLTLLNDGKFLEQVSRPGHMVEVRNDEEVEAIMAEKVGGAMDRNIESDRGASSEGKAPLVTLSEEGAATMASIDKGEAVSSESAINLLSELKTEREALEVRKAAKDRVYTTREYDAMIAVIDDEMAAVNEAITVGTAENVAAKEAEEVSPGIVSQEVEDVIAGIAENKEASIADLKKASKAILKESRRISKDKKLRKSLGNPVVNKEVARLKDVLKGLSSRIDEMEAVAQEEAAKAKELEGTEGKVEEDSAEEKRDDSEDIIEPSVTYEARKKAVQAARKELKAAEAAVENYEGLSEDDQAKAVENLEAAAKRLERAEKAFDKAIKEEAPEETGEGAEKVRSGIAQSVKMTVSDADGVRSAKFTQKIKAKPDEDAPVRRYKTYDDPREFAEDFDIKEGQAGILSAGKVNVKELFVNKDGAFVSASVDGSTVIMPVGKNSPVLKEVQAVELTEKGERASKKIRTKSQVFRAVRQFFKGTDEQAEFASGFIAQMAKARARRFGRPVEDYFQGMVFVKRDGAPSGDELLQRGGTWYYSPTEVALGKISQERGAPEQFKAMLLKNGAKQAELDWMGFDDAFEGQKTISKQNIQALIDENRINIEEVQLGGDLLAVNSKEEALAALEAGYKLEDAEGLIIDISGASVLDELTFPFSVVDSKNRAQYERWQTPGGKNYKEVLLTLPLKAYKTEKQIAEDLEKIRIYNRSFIDMVDYLRSIGQPTPEETVIAKRYIKAHEDARDALPEEARVVNGEAIYAYGNYHRDNFRGKHFGDFLNVAVHVRFNERMDSEGRPVLFIEEIQSDWAQKGKKEGFKDTPAQRKMLERRGVAFNTNGTVSLKSQEEFYGKGETWDLIKKYNETYTDSGAVPGMPFKQTSQWVSLALRRMMQYAAENGFDRIAWTNGEMQVERYDLSMQVSKISYKQEGFAASDNSPMYKIDVYGKEGEKVLGGTYRGDELSGVIGKELAQKVVDGEGQKFYTGLKGSERLSSTDLSGLDLKVGGEGMKAFYDAIVPSAASKLGKPFGANVQEIALGSLSKEYNGVSIEEIKRYSKQVGVDKLFVVQSLPVTESMRRSVMEGVPLFSRRGAVQNMASVAPVTKDTFTPEGKDAMRLYHYSADPNVMTEGVDPRYFGRNAVTSDRRRYGVSFYYTSPNPERVIGGNVHVVTVDKNKVYDLSKDELNVIPEIEQKIREYEKKNKISVPVTDSNIADFSRFVLSDMGYIGIVTDWRAVMADGKARDIKRVELYEKQEVDIAATNNYNRFHSVTPSAADVMRDIEMRASNIVRGLSSNSGMYDVVKNAIRKYYGASADVYSVPESAFLDPRVYKAISVASEPHLAKIFEEYKAYIDEYKIARAASSGHSEVSGLGAAETLYQVAGADSYTKETSAVGASDTQSFGTYNEALEAHPGLSQRNIYVKQGKGANGGRVLAIQLSSPNMIEAMRNGRMHRSDRVFDEYYDAIYNNVDGYDRTIDFMELPFWIAEMAGSMNGKLDMYVSRDNAESSRFLETSGYKKVAMSVMDANLNMVLDMVKNNPGTRFYLGGYVENMDKVFAPYKNAVTIGSIKAGVEAAGFSYTGKYDYSMFRGTAIIPRLKMSSGCKHKCAFCTIPKKVISESKSSVMQQVKALDGLNARYVYLDDKTFGQADNWESLVEVGDALAAQNPSFEGFIIQTTSASIINIDRKDPSFFSRGRIKYAEIGVETNNDYLLKELHKPNRERLNDLAASILRERGVKFIPNVIIGIEGETRESYENTMDYIRRNSDIISHLNVYNLALYEGTELHDKLGVKTDADRNEDILEKSFHSDPALHTEYYFRMFELGKELALGLGKEESPLGAMYDQMTSRVEAGEPLASIQFSDGNAFVTAFKGANIVSFFHEVAGHYTFEDILSVINDSKLSQEVRNKASEELKVIVGAYNKNVKSGTLPGAEYSPNDVFSSREAYIAVHEFFANGFIRWMVDSGSSQDPALIKMFKRFAEWLKGLFEGLKGEGIRLTPELEAIYRDVSNVDYTESEVNPNAVTNEKALVVNLVDKFQVPSTMAKAIGKIAEYSAGRSVISAMDETKEAWYARNYDLLTRLYTEEFTSSPLSNVSDRDFVNKARYILSLLGAKKSSRVALVKPYIDSVYEAVISGNWSAKLLVQKLLDSYNGADGDPVAINDLSDDSVYGDFLRFVSDVFYAYDGETIKSKGLNLVTRLIGPGFRNQSFSPEVIAAISDLRGFVQEAISLATESGVINIMPYSAITGIRRLEGFSGISEASYNRNRSKAKAMFDLFDRRASVSNPKKSPLTKDGWFIISNLYDAGTKPQREANEEAFNFKLAELASRGYMYMRLKDGVYNGVTNPSWIIFGLSAKDAISLGREFKQESILTKDGIVYNNGGYANKVDVIYYGNKIPKELSKYKSTFILHDGSELDMSMDVKSERTPVEGLATRKGLVRNYGVQDEAGRIAVSVSPDGKVSLGAIGDGETMYYPDGAIYPVSEDPYGYGAVAEKEFGAVDKKKGAIMAYIPGKKGIGSSFVLAINSLLGDNSSVKVEIREGQNGEYVILTGKSKTPISPKVASGILAQLDKYYAGAYSPVVVSAKDEEISDVQKLVMSTAYARDNGFSGVLIDSNGSVIIDAWEPPHSSVGIKGTTLFHAKKKKSIPVEKQNVGQAPSMTPQEINENMTRQVKAAKAEAQARAIADKLSNKLGTYIFDRGFALKWAVEQTPGAAADMVKKRLNQVRRAQAIASYQISQAFDKVLGAPSLLGKGKVLNKGERSMLGRYLNLVRIIELDSIADKESRARLTHTFVEDPNSLDGGGVVLNKESAELIVEAMKNGDQAILASFGLKPGYDFARIENAAKEYWMVMEEQIKVLLDEGVITQAAYDKMAAEGKYYSPRLFIEKLEEAVDTGRAATSRTGIHNLQEGSTGNLSEDVQLSLSRKISGTQFAISQAKLGRAMADFLNQNAVSWGYIAEYHPEFIEALNKEMEARAQAALAGIKRPYKYIEPKWVSPRPGYRAITYIKPDSSKGRIYLANDLADVYEGINDTPMHLWDTIGTIMLTKVLKAAATGYNPEFIVRNVPLDVLHILMTQNIYGKTVTFGALKMLKDIFYAPDGQHSVFRDVMLRTGQVLDYYATGGYNQTLGYESRQWYKDKRDDRTAAGEALKSIGSVLAYLGESSELITRLALRRRYINAYKKDAAKQGRVLSDKDLRELESDATEFAIGYLDFSQGGSAIKAVDKFIPYLNAATQVTYGTLRAMRRDPIAYAAKLTELSMYSILIGGWNLGLFAPLLKGLFDDDDEYNKYEAKIKERARFYTDNIDDRTKAGNWILMTNWKFVADDGQQKYVYFKIPKDISTQPILGTIEGAFMSAITKDDKYLVSGQRLKEFQNMISVIDISSLPPLMKAILNYTNNKDLYYNQDIWRGIEVEPYMEYYLGRTPPVYVELGEALNMSPVRLENAINQVITKNNTFYTMAMSATTLMLDDMPAPVEKDEEVWESITQGYFLRRIMATTNYNKDRETLKQLTMRRNTVLQKIDNYIKQSMVGKTGKESVDQIDKVVQGMLDELFSGGMPGYVVSPFDFKRAVRKLVRRSIERQLRDEYVQKGRYDYRIVLSMYYDDAPRAEYIYGLMAEAGPDKSMEIYEAAAELPGYITDEFVAVLSQLDAANGTKYLR